MLTPTPAFSGSIPEPYHRYLGPLIFEPCAKDIVSRLNLQPRARVLELACGTGIVTRHLAAALPPGATLMATDLNEAMLDLAKRTVPPDPRITFQKVDACEPPFPDASFDCIVCQFGVMFFPDKPKAMREARRILAPGAASRYFFNVWDSLEHNPIPAIVHAAAQRQFPANPPSFLKDKPHGYYDRAEIESLMRSAGFTTVTLDTMAFRSESPTAEDAARGYLEGTPLSTELADRGMTDQEPVRRAATDELARRFGARPCRATIQEIVVSAS